MRSCERRSRRLRCTPFTAYETVETRLEQWTKRAKSALGVVKPVNPGMITNTPEMFGVTGHSLERTGASGLTLEVNQVP
jgi:hypothetical protein